MHLHHTSYLIYKSHIIHIHITHHTSYTNTNRCKYIYVHGVTYMSPIRSRCHLYVTYMSPICLYVTYTVSPTCHLYVTYTSPIRCHLHVTCMSPIRSRHHLHVTYTVSPIRSRCHLYVLPTCHGVTYMSQVPFGRPQPPQCKTCHCYPAAQGEYALSVCTFMCVYAFKRVYFVIFLCDRVCVCLYVCVHACVCMCVCECVCMCFIPGASAA